MTWSVQTCAAITDEKFCCHLQHTHKLEFNKDECDAANALELSDAKVVPNNKSSQTSLLTPSMSDTFVPSPESLANTAKMMDDYSSQTATTNTTILNDDNIPSINQMFQKFSNLPSDENFDENKSVSTLSQVDAQPKSEIIKKQKTPLVLKQFDENFQTKLEMIVMSKKHKLQIQRKNQYCTTIILTHTAIHCGLLWLDPEDWLKILMHLWTGISCAAMCFYE